MLHGEVAEGEQVQIVEMITRGSDEDRLDGWRVGDRARECLHQGDIKSASNQLRRGNVLPAPYILLHGFCS